MTRRFYGVVAYDGTNYHGWQTQPDFYTVEETMVQAFRTVFKARISLRGASRTDAGVHAAGQVISFYTDLPNLTAEQIKKIWNNHLPLDISVRQLRLAPQNFDLYASVVDKIYQYQFFMERPTPFISRFGWYYTYPLDLVKLRTALQLLVGEHDFRSFCTGYERENTVRTIFSIKLKYRRAQKAYCIEICGNAFLKYMVRRIVGAALKIAACPQLPVAYLQTILAQRHPEHTLPTAPACGLTLAKIRYARNKG